MTSEGPRISDQAMAVLAEVASQPGSTLLRMSVRKTLAAFHEEALGACRMTAGLRSAERELLRVHRAEVAWLLRQASVRMLIEGPGSRRFVNAVDYEDATTRPSPAEIVRRARALPEERDSDSDPALAWLQAFSRWPEIANARCRDVAALAHRLEPTHQSRLVVCLDMIHGQESRSSLVLLGQVLDASPTAEEEETAVSAAGLAHARLGDHARACRVLRGVLGPEVFSAPGTMTMLLSSLAAERAEDAVEAGARLEERVTREDRTVTEFIQGMQDQRRRGDWLPDARARRSAASFADRIGPVGRRIVDEVF
jgi:hypothetical protein